MSKDDRELIERLRGLLAKAELPPLVSADSPWVRDEQRTEIYHVMSNRNTDHEMVWARSRLVAEVRNALPTLLDSLEALQAQPVAARELAARRAGDTVRVDYSMMGRDELANTVEAAVRAALTASPPVVERESIARVIDPEAFSSIGNTHLKEALGRGPRDRDAALAKADAILALTPGEGVGERNYRAEARALCEAMQIDAGQITLHWAESFLRTLPLSTPVAQGDEVVERMAKAHFEERGFALPGDADWEQIGHIRHATLIAKMRAALATVTKGARDAG